MLLTNLPKFLFYFPNKENLRFLRASLVEMTCCSDRHAGVRQHPAFLPFVISNPQGEKSYVFFSNKFLLELADEENLRFLLASLVEMTRKMFCPKPYIPMAG